MAPDQASEFLDYAEGHDIMLYALFSLVAVWGLRRGEACGLRDIDIDLDPNIITIVQQRTSVGYKPIERKVEIRRRGPDPADRQAHRRDPARLPGHARTDGNSPPDRHGPTPGCCSSNPTASPGTPNCVSERFELLAATPACHRSGFHDLRHCAATYLKLAGADMKTIQEILGHSSIVITSDTYTLLFADLDRTVTGRQHHPRRPTQQSLFDVRPDPRPACTRQPGAARRAFLGDSSLPAAMTGRLLPAGSRESRAWG